jgi:hypothetical protein
MVVVSFSWFHDVPPVASWLLFITASVLHAANPYFSFVGLNAGVIVWPFGSIISDSCTDILLVTKVLVGTHLAHPANLLPSNEVSLGVGSRSHEALYIAFSGT